MIYKIVHEGKNIFYELWAALPFAKKHIQYRVPYLSQCSSAENAERILRQEMPLDEDLSWASTGAASPEEYEQWAMTMCGMACTAMALTYFFKEKTLPVPLAKDAYTQDVYTKHDDVLSSMKYFPYQRWVSSKKLHARVHTRMSIRSILHSLHKGFLVIASVNPNIRGYTTAPPHQKGGHLVLITGYNPIDKTLTLHNPSGFPSMNSAENHILTLSDFQKHFGGRGKGISIRPQ